MLYTKNLRIIFLALFLAGAVPVLCIADGKNHHGTRVNVGPHIDWLSGANLRMIVQYQNPSSNPITIKEIRVYKPNGEQVFPEFAAAGFPVPLDLGPFESRGFPLSTIGVHPVTPPPLGTFQVHADWESKRPSNGLKSFSIVVRSDFGSGVTSSFSVEGFDIKRR